MSRRPTFLYPGYWRLRLRPDMLAGELRRVAGKLGRRRDRLRRRVAQLAARGPHRGRALVSYMVEPCLGDAERELPRSHTHFWESRQIALTFAELGFDVDVIDWTNGAFMPRVPYDVVLDVRVNLERLAPLVGESCLLIQHMETAHHSFHNRAQRRRLQALARRRGRPVRPQKLIEENRAIEVAHFGTTVGNEFTKETYVFAGKEIFRVPISTPLLYPPPREKDLEAARRCWLWFGSGGLVHKGLDLVLEAFAAMPDHQLTVCGPVHLERDFEAEYATELYATPNVRLEGWVDVASARFRKILGSTLGAVYPSSSEGGGGSVVTCLHAGLVPLVTREASVDLDGFGFRLEEATVDAIREAVRRVSALPADELRRRSMAAWSHAREHHTRESFARDFRSVIERILERWEARRR